MGYWNNGVFEYWVLRDLIYFYMDGTDRKIKSGHNPLYPIFHFQAKMIQTDFNFFSPSKEAGLNSHPVYRRSCKILDRCGVLWIIILALLWSCSNGEPPASVSEGPARNLRLVIKWPGDDLASKQDLELRDKIEQRLLEKKIGKIVRSGTGMGWMDIVFEVKDPDRAHALIEATMKSIAPDAKFVIQTE